MLHFSSAIGTVNVVVPIHFGKQCADKTLLLLTVAVKPLLVKNTSSSKLEENDNFQFGISRKRAQIARSGFLYAIKYTFVTA